MFAQQMVGEKASAERSHASSSASLGVPANVLAAASNLFVQHHGRPASSTAEALAFAQQLAQSKSQSTATRHHPSSSAATEASSSADNGQEDLVPETVPAPVLAAAFSIFEQHLGRPAANTEEALAFAQRVVASSGGAEPRAGAGALLPAEPPPAERHSSMGTENDPAAQSAAASAESPLDEEQQRLVEPSWTRREDEEVDEEEVRATSTCCFRVVHALESWLERFVPLHHVNKQAEPGL